MVCANRVTTLLNPQTASARRIAKAAKEADAPAFIDATFSRPTKCLILLDDGTVIACALTYRTLMARLHAVCPEDNGAENSDAEDIVPENHIDDSEHSCDNNKDTEDE